MTAKPDRSRCPPCDAALSALGSRLRELRRNAGLTQADLAGRAGIARDTLSRIENGGTAETAIVHRVADLLGHALTIERRELRAADMRSRFAHLHADEDE